MALPARSLLLLLLLTLLAGAAAPAPKKAVPTPEGRKDRIEIIWPEKPPCDWACTLEYAPLCVAGPSTPLTTASNGCFARRIACAKQTPLYIVHRGECRCP